MDWRFCIVGALLGAGVVAVAFFDQAAVAIMVAGLVALWCYTRSATSASASTPARSPEFAGYLLVRVAVP